MCNYSCATAVGSKAACSGALWFFVPFSSGPVPSVTERFPSFKLRDVGWEVRVRGSQQRCARARAPHALMDLVVSGGAAHDHLLLQFSHQQLYSLYTKVSSVLEHKAWAGWGQHLLGSTAHLQYSITKSTVTLNRFVIISDHMDACGSY